MLMGQWKRQGNRAGAGWGMAALSGLWIFALVAGIGLSACGGRSVSGINQNQNEQDGSVRQDGSPDTDGGLIDADMTDGTVRPDAAGCEHGDSWSVVDVPIDDIRILTTEALGGPATEGIGVRIQALITIGGCEEPAGLIWEQDFGNQQIVLHASKWVYNGPRPCPEFEMQVPLFAAVSSWERGRWTVVDANSYLAADFGVRRCPQGEDCYCELWDGIPGDVGDSCHYDCQCSYPMTCVFDGAPTFPPQGHCYKTCSSDSDCSAEAGLTCQMGVLDAPEGVCVRGDRTCNNDSDCKPGFSCLPAQGDPSVKVCRPTMPEDLTTDRCEDDCDCPEGYKCSDVFRAKTCVIPCRGMFDCPGTLCCGMWLDHDLYSGPICTECMDYTD